METEQSDRFGTGAGFDGGAGATPGAGASGGTVGQAKEKAQQLVGQGKEQVTRRFGASAAQLKGQASGALGNFAEAMRQAGQQFREQDRGIVGGYAERAAEQAKRLSEHLQRTEVDELVKQLEGVARRAPAAFLGGAFAVGVVGARFLKSSRRRRSERLDRERAAGAGLGAAGASSGAYAADVDVTGRQPITREGASPTIGGDAFPPAARESGLDPLLAPPTSADDRLR
jgi:hypothetical protein